MNVDAMIKHHQAATEVITHAMSDYASAATGTSWNKACFAFEADAILCALSRAGYRILGPDEVDQVTVEKCAEIASCQFDDRGNGRSGHYSEMDWTDGYRDATRAAAAAIRAIGRKA